MNNGLIAKRYAIALLEFVSKEQAELEVYTQAKILLASYAEHKDLRVMLESPVMSFSDKKKLIVAAFGGSVHPLLNQFIDLILKKRREDRLQYVMLKYIELYREAKNVFAAKLVTASEVDTKVHSGVVSIVENNTNGTTEISNVVDPQIIGGFMLEFNGMRWDASVRGQLRVFEENFLKRSI